MRSLTQTKAKSTFTPIQSGLLQRQCASCDQQTIAGGECAECSKKKQPLQRRAANQAEVSQVPPIVHEVLRSQGASLDPDIRLFMESRFGHDFSQVRVHTGVKEAESAKAISSLAYTVGRDLVFGTGQYAPKTTLGKQLLAHELTHVVQQNNHQSLPGDGLQVGIVDLEGAEAEADRVAETIETASASVYQKPITQQMSSRTIQRQSPPATSITAPARSMTREEFERTLKQQYTVRSIRTGEFHEQQMGDMKESDWQSWDPGSTSPVYAWITEAFSNVAKQLGGVPPVQEIVFFKVNYQRNPDTQKVEKHPEIGASYSSGRLVIYENVKQGNAILRPGATLLALPSQEQAVRQNITHELGHGIAEIALTQRTDRPGADPDLMKDYEKTVGWVRTGSDESTKLLFDIQQPSVQKAIKDGKVPPTDWQITKDDTHKVPWYDSRWKERPVTGYMTTNPAEDFAEALMVYINEPATLQAMSPARFKFIEAHKSLWKSRFTTGPSTLKKPDIKPPIPKRPKFPPLYQPRTNFNRELEKSLEDI